MGEMITIDDNNYKAFRSQTVDGVEMKCASLGMWEPGYEQPGGYAGAFEDQQTIPMIPEDEWRDRIRQQEKDKTRIVDLADDLGMKIRNQRNSNYCWAFGTCRSVEYALLQTGVNKYISPFSVGAPIKNFRNQGGWGDQALDYMARNGFNFDDEWNAEGGASSISRRYYTDENRAKAKERKVLEYYKLRSGSGEGWKQLVSCVLSGVAVGVGYNWWGHLVCAVGLNTDLDLLIDNSWGPNWSSNGRGYLSGRRKYADGAVAITSVQAM